MFLRKLKQSIQQMPTAPYIFLRWLLVLACAMLGLSLLLFWTAGASLPRLHLATVLLEVPAGVLLLGGIGLAFLWDQTM